MEDIRTIIPHKTLLKGQISIYSDTPLKIEKVVFAEILRKRGK